MLFLYIYIFSSSVLSNTKISLSKNLPIQMCTSSFLQQQMNAALALNSPAEYKIMLLTLVRFYAQEGKLHLFLIMSDLGFCMISNVI